MTPTLMFIFSVYIYIKKNCAFHKPDENFHVKYFISCFLWKEKKLRLRKEVRQEPDCKITLYIQLVKNLFNLKDTVITCQIFIQRHMYVRIKFPP